MREEFVLVEGVTTRQVNKAVRDASKAMCAKWDMGVQPNEQVMQYKGVRRYVFGIGHSLRDTLVASYTPGENKIMIVFPNKYAGWRNADPYSRLRIAIRDEIVYKSGIIARF